jgi:hypothetical protein
MDGVPVSRVGISDSSPARKTVRLPLPTVKADVAWLCAIKIRFRASYVKVWLRLLSRLLVIPIVGEMAMLRQRRCDHAALADSPLADAGGDCKCGQNSPQQAPGYEGQKLNITPVIRGARDYPNKRYKSNAK